MRRRDTSGGPSARWTIHPLETDPYDLPIRLRLRHAKAPRRWQGCYDDVVVGRRAVAVRQTRAGIRGAIRVVPIKAFKGVAVELALHDGPEGNVRVSISLQHEEAGLCVPLLVAFDLEIAGARCQSWAQALGLPLLLPTADGGFVEWGERLGSLRIKPPKPRRAALVLSDRKPNFCKHRLPAAKSVSRLDGREMIARA